MNLLTRQECALLLDACWDHPVSWCETCRRSYKLYELESESAASLKFQSCTVCGSDMVHSLREHLRFCPQLNVFTDDEF
jgi:hypothetical protein